MKRIAYVFGAVLLASPVARAADPNTPRIGPEEGPRAKAERVLGGLGGEADAWRARLKKGELPARDLVHRILLAKDADYKKAVEVFERDGSNTEDFQKLVARDSDPALRAHATYFLGRTHLNLDEFDKACECFEKVRGELANGTAWTDEATLYLGYAYARRPELEEDKERLYKARAKSCLETLAPLDGSKPVYGSSPERAKESASWLLKELMGEGSGPLLELARRMDTVEHSIDHEKTGRPTQKRQEAIISEIDRLIALMREKEQGGDGKGGDGKKGGKSQKKGNAGNPRPKSILPESGDAGPIRNQKSGGSADWGAMNEKEREQALQLLKEKFPERYKEIVEQYYKSLAEQKENKKK
ncbi:MAG: tol-pal system YbgF family protein [Planctomycetota bacterium]